MPPTRGGQVLVSNTRVGTHLEMPLADNHAIFIYARSARYAWNKLENDVACNGERQSGFNQD